MDYLTIIKQPIQEELESYISLFNSSLNHKERLQEEIFSGIRNSAGKRMRPMLILLIAKNYGSVNDSTLHAAVGLELLHTASLIHDDVVDESYKRRGLPSVNARFDNKVAVLLGDYILSTSLLHISLTNNVSIIRHLGELGRTLSDGEILEITANFENLLLEDTYYSIIRKKTAALFEACCAMGAISVGLPEDRVEEVKKFGSLLGTIFQIKDDIFDYYESTELGKPTGSDMAEGKLTLPVIYALNHTDNKDMLLLAKKVKQRTITSDEIAQLVKFSKDNGGIEYAESCMQKLRCEAQRFITKQVKDDTLRTALDAYLSYVIERT
ncbi:MAG: polyprenyl synthetase family protein, partial [Prevotella sp.]|nr:polyprenyl synthetase family protein [Prevotella sp.]